MDVLCVRSLLHATSYAIAFRVHCLPISVVVEIWLKNTPSGPFNNSNKHTVLILNALNLSQESAKILKIANTTTKPVSLKKHISSVDYDN